jgi:hypothetical protein
VGIDESRSGFIFTPRDLGKQGNMTVFEQRFTKQGSGHGGNSVETHNIPRVSSFPAKA